MATKSSKKGGNKAQKLASGSNIRFQEASSSRRAKRHSHKLIGVAPEVNPMGNFLGFLREHAVVGLIIGFVLGNEVQTVVKQIIQSFIDPLTQLLFGTALSDRSFTLHFHHRVASFSWGATVYAFIIFLFVVLTLYLVVKMLRLESANQDA